MSFVKDIFQFVHVLYAKWQGVVSERLLNTGFHVDCTYCSCLVKMAL